MPRRRDGNALDASVLEDIDTILNAFEADPLRSLASFRHLAERFRVSDLHLTPRAGGREPGVPAYGEIIRSLRADRELIPLGPTVGLGLGASASAPILLTALPSERRAPPPALPP